MPITRIILPLYLIKHQKLILFIYYYKLIYKGCNLNKFNLLSNYREIGCHFDYNFIDYIK